MDEEILIRIKTELTELVLFFGPKLIYAIVSLLIGIVLINVLMRILRAALTKSKVELSLKTFIESLS